MALNRYASSLAMRCFPSLRTSLSCVAILCSVAIGSSAMAAEQALLRAVPDAELSKDIKSVSNERLAHIKKELTTERVNVVRLDANALAVDATQIAVGDGKTRNFTKVRVQNHKPGFYSWYGKLSGVEGDATLVVNNGNITGTIRDGGELYRIEPLGEGLHALIKVDQQRLPPDHPPSFYNKPAGPLPKMDSSASSSSAPAASRLDINSALTGAAVATAAASGRPIDILVGYTAAAKTAVGDIDATIQLAINETNQSYLNSGINIQLNLVDKMEVAVTEAGNSYDTILANFTSNAAVNSHKSANGADVAVLIVNQGDYCGMANAIMASAANAYAVVHYSCATGYYSFAHEIGHLQGARHDPLNDPTTTPFAYGHGYQSPGTSPSWRTIMAYNCSGAFCARLQYWSNPDVLYNGLPMGTAATHNNARVLNETSATVAGFAPTMPCNTMAKLSDMTVRISGKAAYKLSNNNCVQTMNAGNSFVDAGRWLASGLNVNDYQVRATQTSATACDVGGFGSWIPGMYVSAAYWSITSPSISTTYASCSFLIEVRATNNPGVIISSANITLSSGNYR